jgi:hypothetical protein
MKHTRITFINDIDEKFYGYDPYEMFYTCDSDPVGNVLCTTYIEERNFLLYVPLQGIGRLMLLLMHTEYTGDTCTHILGTHPPQNPPDFQLPHTSQTSNVLCWRK